MFSRLCHSAFLSGVLTVAALSSPVFSADVADKSVKVFILAGQSNMEGKAKVSLLEYQLNQPETSQQFQHLWRDGQWVVRDDVWIKFLDRKGNLTVGYGSPGCIGPELEFGNTVGDHYDQQVLIIKAAWGGKSLYRDFRPPSSGLPSSEVLRSMLDQLQQRNPEATIDDVKQSFGAYYRLMLDEIRNTLANLKNVLPDYNQQGYEISGFVWFQGWNDMINSDYTAEYADNMANLIRDVRKDLKLPEMPVVIGQMGVGGLEEDANPKRQRFKDAQAAVGKLAEFEGNVSVVETDQFWDMAADAIFKKGWRENVEEWNKVGSDYPYHYLGSAQTYSRIGRAFGMAIIALSQKETLSFYDPVEQHIQGWTIAVDPTLLAEEHRTTASKAFEALANHLQRIEYIMPEDRLEKLRSLRIWIERDNPKLGSMQYHPNRGWLIAHGHDPRLVKHVHIPHADRLYDPKMWAKHPYVILHELAHSYHDQVLNFDAPEIIAAFEDAKEKGIYENVLLYTGQKVRHYGLSNHKEYFAEATEAYFGVNDFYPFVRAELKEHDQGMFSLLEKVWGRVE